MRFSWMMFIVPMTFFSFLPLALVSAPGQLGPLPWVVATAAMIVFGHGVAYYLLRIKGEEFRLATAGAMALATVIMAFLQVWIIKANDAPKQWARPLPVWLEDSLWVLFVLAFVGALPALWTYLRALFSSKPY